MNVLIGVSGGIAAYKSATLIREFKKRGCAVKVVMTSAAKDFITPLTLATLSGNPVYVEGFSPENGAWNSHISLGEWGDVMVIAPATANTIAKMVSGIADNLLCCTYLSARCPVVVAPAMDLDMWAHKATGRNIEQLKADGVRVIEPAAGFLASGLTGKGRMEEPEMIAKIVCEEYMTKRDFEGKRVLVTYGATVERIDAVRYISNFSTGKMGRAIAEEFQKRGAEVVAVGGGVSASEMYEQARTAFESCDIAVFAAAVADYTVENPSEKKIKSDKGKGISLSLAPTVDIAGTLSRGKREGQFTLGFALETNDEELNAQKKLESKNLDAIVLNSLQDSGAGFGHDTNKVTIFDNSGSYPYSLKSKSEVATDIVNYVASKV